MTEKHELAYRDYKQGMKYKDIAEKHGVTINTVKSWKTRHWGSKKGVHTKSKKSVHTKKSAKKQSSRKGIGNPSPVRKFTERNSAAVTHGFFRTIFPEEAHGLVESIMEKSALDMLWENIIIQYTAIARAQEIMFVIDREDAVIEVKRKKESETKNSSGKGGRKDKELEYEIQFAWDRHANLLMAQSKAMGILTSMIKRFKGMAGDDDERRLKLEAMVMDLEEAKVKKAKAEATVAEKVAGKLVGDTKSHDLMKSLIDVASGGTGVPEDS